MWNEVLIRCAAAYPSAVLTSVEDSGYPASVRCRPTFDAAQQQITFADLPPLAADWRGPACLLFHRHAPDLGDQHELLITGTLAPAGGTLALAPKAFLTGSGRQDTDRMAVAGSPLDLLRFLLLGRRQARAYLARRGAPWPPRPWDKMLRSLDEL